MFVGITLTSCLAVLSALTFAESSIIPLDYRQVRTRQLFAADDVKAGLLHRKEAFLAGEDTPVWIAYYENPNDTVRLTYRKLEKGIVKQAIDYLKSDKFKGITKEKRSVDENMNLLKEGDESTNSSTHSSISHLTKRRKREDNTKVFYPSVLAVMEYGKTWPSTKEDEQTLILERILYALAFWNSVDLQLIEIEDPHVRIRLSGIVIAKDRDATNNLYEIYGYRKLLHYEGTLLRLAQYWGDRMRQKIDFMRGTYNIVALMTDEVESPDRSTDGLFPDGPPCNHDNPGATGVLIASDDLEFSGLQEAVRITARMLGHGSDNNPECKYRSEWKKRVWNKCDLDSIRQSLVRICDFDSVGIQNCKQFLWMVPRLFRRKQDEACCIIRFHSGRNGWCMEFPMEYHDPGKPVETILPGTLTSLERQCKAHGWAAGHACKKWTCEALRCQEDYISLCVKRHPAMDGSECGVGMICLNAQCISNTTLTRW